MKKLTIFVTCLSILLFTSTALAKNYFGVTTGGVFPLDLESDNKGGTVTLYNVDLSTGGMFGLKLGHIFPETNNIFTIEFEGYVIEGTDVENEFYYYAPPAPLAAVNLDANISIKILMVNVLARHPEGQVHPYVGLGIGWVRFEMDNITLILEPGFFWVETGTRTYRVGDVDDDTFGVQSLFGVGIDFADNLTIDLGVRYFYAESDLKRGDAFDVEVDYGTYMITAGLNFAF